MTTEYQIEYYTHNIYEYMVSEGFYEFLVMPCADATQEVTKVHFRNNLHVEVFHHTNPFGFKATSLRAVKPFKEFEFWMKATVEKIQPAFPQSGQLSVAEELAILADYNFYVDHHFFWSSANTLLSQICMPTGFYSGKKASLRLSICRN